MRQAIDKEQAIALIVKHPSYDSRARVFGVLALGKYKGQVIRVLHLPEVDMCDELWAINTNDYEIVGRA